MGFFSKLFGTKSSSPEDNSVKSLIEETISGIIEKGQFELDFEVVVENLDNNEVNYRVEFSGNDEELLKDKKGQMLDAIQLLIKRVVQHNFPDDKSNLTVDCGGYRDENAQALIERAENLKAICIEQGKAVYYRALPPKDRKIVHQYLAQDVRIKSRSLGDGLYKKIKIYPAKGNSASQDANQE